MMDGTILVEPLRGGECSLGCTSVSSSPSIGFTCGECVAATLLLLLLLAAVPWSGRPTGLLSRVAGNRCGGFLAFTAAERGEGEQTRTNSGMDTVGRLGTGDSLTAFTIGRSIELLARSCAAFDVAWQKSQKKNKMMNFFHHFFYEDVVLNATLAKQQFSATAHDLHQ